jgi:hypothetical protein
MEGTDGVDLKLEVTVMDKDHREQMRGEAVEEAVPRRMFIRKQDVEEHGYTVRCPGCVSILKGTARQEHSTECRRRLERELGMTERAKRAKKKVGEYVEKKMEDDEDARRKRSEEKNMKEDSMNDETPVSHQDAARSAVGEAEKRKRSEGDDEGEEERMKAQESRKGTTSPEVGKGGGSRKRVVEEEVSEEKTATYLKKLERQELKRKGREGGQDDGKYVINEVRIAGHVVNEEVMEVAAEADQWGEIEDSEDELDPKQVTIGRQEELEFIVGRLAMFEFGSYEEAIQRGG